MEVNNNNQEQPTKSGGYKVENIILIESFFSREVSIDVKEYSITNEISINSEAHETSADNKIGVVLVLDYKGKQNDLIVCTSKIKMVGIFEKTGEPALSEEAFKKINAPAIIYPFIREHLHNICLKAGISNILLPTVNFKL
jgi:preprotein translocase subunit SecB